MKKNLIGKEELEKAWEKENKNFNPKELGIFFCDFLKEKQIQFKDQEIHQII